MNEAGGCGCGPLTAAAEVLRARPDIPNVGYGEQEELYALLVRLHRARVGLQAEEERVLVAAHVQGLSLRRLARALEVASPDTVAHRLRRIRRQADPDEAPSSAGRPAMPPE